MGVARRGGLRHGHARDGQVSPTWRSWQSMMNRCERPHQPQYADYGAKGVRVCERWKTFDNFLADMGHRPSGKTLDRIDNAKGYEPGNVRWATTKEQGSNRACVDNITYQGRTQNPEDWARELGLKPQTIRSRIARGWPLERVLTKPATRGCPGTRNSHAKLNEELVRQIRLESTGAYGEQAEFARKYGVSTAVIQALLCRRTWRHV